MPVGILGVRYQITTAGAVAAGRPTLPVPAPTFVVGVSYPDVTTVGAGIIRPYPTDVINGDVTLANGQTLVDKVINGRVFAASGATATMENCVVRGPVVPPASPVNLVYTTNAHLVTLRYCTVAPQSTWWWTGVGDKNYRLEQCDVFNCVDTLGCFSLATDADPTVNIAVIGSWLHDLARFSPDFGNSRSETHNDCIQLQGNIGPADDVLIDGSRLDGNHSLTYGDAPTTLAQHIQLSAVMLTPNTRDRVSVTVKRSWLSGGAYTLNGAKSQPNSVVVLDGNRWEKPHPSTGGPGAAIALSPTITSRTITNQTYADDGSTVPVYATA